MKYLSLILLSLIVSGCGSDNSDGSDPTTYSSCSIISSEALFASDREKDVSQCWDGVDFKEKSLALNWCSEQVNDYIGSEYVFGHSVQYQVSSTYCPSVNPPLGGNNESGSQGSNDQEPTTPPEPTIPLEPSYIYESCGIVSSNALFQSDRDKDVSQCWDEQGFNNSVDALAWCKGKVEDYIDQEYIFGHSVEYQVTTWKCS